MVVTLILVKEGTTKDSLVGLSKYSWIIEDKQLSELSQCNEISLCLH